MTHLATSPITSGVGGSQPSLSQLAPGLEIVDGAITGSGPEAGDARQRPSHRLRTGVAAPIRCSVLPSFEDPPTAAPVYQVAVDYNYQGVDGSMTINYRLGVGTDAWISMPPQTLWPGVVVTQQRWIRAPDRTVAGFEGQLTPEPVPTPPPTTESAARSAASTTNSSWLPALVVGGLAILVGGAVLVAVRRRDVPRRTPDPTPRVGGGGAPIECELSLDRVAPVIYM